jgi:hypothetical protein
MSRAGRNELQEDVPQLFGSIRLLKYRYCCIHCWDITSVTIPCGKSKGHMARHQQVRNLKRIVIAEFQVKERRIQMSADRQRTPSAFSMSSASMAISELSSTNKTVKPSRSARGELAIY